MDYQPSPSRIGMARTSLFCAVFSSIGAFLLGFDTGIFVTTIAHISFNIYMFDNFLGNAVLTGAIASTYTAGTAIGSVFSGWAGDTFGRKKCIIAAAGTVTIATIIQTAAMNIGMFIAGRVIAGLAIGVILSIVPVYNSELAAPKHRGITVGVFAVMVSFGVLCSNWIGYACFFAVENAQWRIPLGCQAPMAIILCVGAFFLPESPRWLVKKDRSQEAYAILKQIHKGLGDDFINREFTQMHEQITAEGNSSFLDCFRTRTARKRMALGIFVNVFNNLGGTPVISVYQSALFKQMGFNGLRTLYLSGFYGLAGLVGVIINITLVADRMGRKTSMIWGAITLLVDLIILMPLSKIYTGSANLAGEAAAVTFIFLHSFLYSIFMFGTVWVYTTEIFPTHLRAKGTAICIFAGQVVALILQQIGLIVFNDIHYWFYLVFIISTAVALAVYYIYLPETMGVTLEEISAFFGDEVVATMNESKSRIEAIMFEIAGNGSTRIEVEPRTVMSAEP